MLGKKGQGLSIETIIILVIAVLVLVAVILIFSGQAGEIFQSVQDFISGITTPTVDVSEAVQ
jgi:hypothetical protein